MAAMIGVSSVAFLRAAATEPCRKDFRTLERDNRSMKRLLSAAVAASFLVTPVGAQAANSATPSQQLMSKLQWRSIGPYIGGRAVAVAGVPGNPNLFYFG